MMRVAISSGHGLKIQGAVSEYANEVDEARKVTESVATELRDWEIDVVTFHDDVSDDQSENLNRIVDWHNAQSRQLDVSVHFNSFSDPAAHGTEVCYKTQEHLAGELAKAIAKAGKLTNRGGKLRNDLYFLNGTEEPAVLLEVCFISSESDVALYQQHYDEICQAIADCIGEVFFGQEV